MRSGCPPCFLFWRFTHLTHQSFVTPMNEYSISCILGWGLHLDCHPRRLCWQLPWIFWGPVHCGNLQMQTYIDQTRQYRDKTFCKSGIYSAENAESFSMSYNLYRDCPNIKPGHHTKWLERAGPDFPGVFRWRGPSMESNSGRFYFQCWCGHHLHDSSTGPTEPHGYPYQCWFWVWY